MPSGYLWESPKGRAPWSAPCRRPVEPATEATAAAAMVANTHAVRSWRSRPQRRRWLPLLRRQQRLPPSHSRTPHSSRRISEHRKAVMQPPARRAPFWHVVLNVDDALAVPDVGGDGPRRRDIVGRLSLEGRHRDALRQRHTTSWVRGKQNAARARRDASATLSAGHRSSWTRAQPGRARLETSLSSGSEGLQRAPSPWRARLQHQSARVMLRLSYQHSTLLQLSGLQCSI